MLSRVCQKNPPYFQSTTLAARRELVSQRGIGISQYFYVELMELSFTSNKKYYRPRFTRLLKSLLGTKQVCVFQRFNIFKLLSTCIEHELLGLVLSCIRLIIERGNLMKWITHKELHDEFLKEPEFRVAYEAELKNSESDYQIIYHHDDGTEEVVFDNRESKFIEK